MAADYVRDARYSRYYTAGVRLYGNLLVLMQSDLIILGCPGIILTATLLDMTATREDRQEG